MNCGITKSRSGHYTVWVRGHDTAFVKLELHQARRILTEVKEALASDRPAERLKAIAIW